MGLVATGLDIADIDQWQSSYLAYFYKVPLNNCILETLPLLYYSYDIFPFLEIHKAHKHGKSSKKYYCKNKQSLYWFNPEFSDHIWPWNLHSPPSPIIPMRNMWPHAFCRILWEKSSYQFPINSLCCTFSKIYSLFYFSGSIRMT